MEHYRDLAVKKLTIDFREKCFIRYKSNNRKGDCDK